MKMSIDEFIGAFEEGTVALVIDHTHECERVCQMLNDIGMVPHDVAAYGTDVYKYALNAKSRNYPRLAVTEHAYNGKLAVTGTRRLSDSGVLARDISFENKDATDALNLLFGDEI